MYIFKKTRDIDNSHDLTNVEISIDHNDITRSDLLEAFEEFLKACGFAINGTIEVIEEEENNG
jgi:hypothetical protein